VTETANSLELPNVLDDIIGARSSEIQGAVVCEVLEFDCTNQTARVQPTVLANGVRPADVRGVPVVFPGAYHDVQVGTFGVLLTGAVNPRKWFRTGQVSEPEDEARHELATGLFLPDLRTLGGARGLDADTAVLLRPAAGGEVRLGTYNATKAVVHEDLLTALSTFLQALDTWGAAIGAGWVPAVRTPLQAIVTGVTAGSYESPSVKVED